MFGKNVKVNTLVYHNQVNSAGGGYVVANALLGVRNGDSIQMASAYGVALISPKQQYITQVVRKCKKFLFIKKCHNENVNVPRGFYHQEIQAITLNTERRAALAMRKSLGLGNAVPAPLVDSLGSGFIDEHQKLSNLYPKIEYEYTDVENIEIGGWNSALIAAMKGHGDQGVRDRMNQFLQAHVHSNFVFAATNKILFYVILHNHRNGNFNLHVSQFTVASSHNLPTGAFATSIGAWSLERGGAGANPSIHQILGIFGFK